VVALAEDLSGQRISECCGPIRPYEALFWHVLLKELHDRANVQGTRAARGAGAAAVASVTEARACLDAADAITPDSADLLQLIERHALAEVPDVATAGHLIEIARVAINFGDASSSSNAISLAAKLVGPTMVMPCVSDEFEDRSSWAVGKEVSSCHVALAFSAWCTTLRAQRWVHAKTSHILRTELPTLFSTCQACFIYSQFKQ
jgi:hypothetical protein